MSPSDGRAAQAGQMSGDGSNSGISGAVRPEIPMISRRYSATIRFAGSSTEIEQLSEPTMYITVMVPCAERFCT